MAKLPAWSWLIVGLIVAVTSSVVEIPLFFWLGVVFVAIGAGKYALAAMTREKTPKEKHLQQHVQRHQAQHQQAHHAAAMRHPTHQYYRCSCGAPVKVSDNFCNHCGRRLR